MCVSVCLASAREAIRPISRYLCSGVHRRYVSIISHQTRYDPVRSVSRHLPSLHRTAIAMSRPATAWQHQYDVDEDNDDEGGVCCKCLVHQPAAIDSSAVQQISVIAYYYECDDEDDDDGEHHQHHRLRQHRWQQRRQPRTTGCPVV